MNTSNFRHETRDQVLVAYASDQIARQGLSQDRFAERLNLELNTASPERCRQRDYPDLKALEKTAAVADYGRIYKNWSKRIERWLSGEVEVPAWIEDAWVAALDPEWHERCVNELAARHGLIGARAVAADACPVGAFAQLVTRLGQAIEMGSEVLADGKIDAGDLPLLPEFIARLLAVESRACELRRKAENELAANAGAQALALVR